MGRRSALNEKQWDAIEKRALDGEPVRALAREFDISEAAIRKRIGTRTKTIKIVANQLVEAETAFAALPLGAQISARTLADRLKALSNHVAGGSEYAAATFHRLSMIANNQVDKIDEANPASEESVKALQAIAFLTKTANDAAEVPINLIKANKDSMDDLNRRELDKADAKERAQAVVPNDASEAASAYQQLMRD